MLNPKLLPAALFAAACLTLPAVAVTVDDTTTKTTVETTTKDKSSDKSDKPAEKAPPTEVTSEGSITVGGQHIAYTAIAGTLTVGATDVDDAQLGPDGKPQPGSQLALNEPRRSYVLLCILQERRKG